MSQFNTEVALEVLDVLIVLCLGSGFGIMPFKKTHY